MERQREGQECINCEVAFCHILTFSLVVKMDNRESIRPHSVLKNNSQGGEIC